MVMVMVMMMMMMSAELNAVVAMSRRSAAAALAARHVLPAAALPICSPFAAAPRHTHTRHGGSARHPGPDGQGAIASSQYHTCATAGVRAAAPCTRLTSQCRGSLGYDACAAAEASAIVPRRYYHTGRRLDLGTHGAARTLLFLPRVVHPIAHARCHGGMQARCYVRPSGPLYRGRGLFKRIFSWRRRREYPTDQPEDPEKLTLFNQSMLPEDLRLPTPADPLFRVGAGIADAVVSGIGGAAAAAAAYYASDGAAELAAAAGQGTALLLWVLRDSLADEGTRSFGKKWFKLELTYWDGTLATPAHARMRNVYFLILPFMAMHPIASMIGSIIFFFDAASVVITSDARKAGDYLFGTRVVNERPGRDVRVQDMWETMEVRRLRAEIEHLAPGMLASRTTSSASAPPATTSVRVASGGASSGASGSGWYEDVQREVVTIAAAEAAAAEKAARAAAAELSASAIGAAGASTKHAPVGVAAATSPLPLGAFEQSVPPLPSGGLASIFSEVRDAPLTTGAVTGAADAGVAGAAGSAGGSGSSNPLSGLGAETKHGDRRHGDRPTLLANKPAKRTNST